MLNRNAFVRAKVMFAAIQAAMSYTNEVERQAALAMIGPYESRGHGGGHKIKSRHRVAMDKRVATKARNVKRNKAH